MKIIRLLVAAVTASLLTSTAALSEEKTTGLSNDYGQFSEYDMSSHKDQCLIVAKNCLGDDSVRIRVERLNREIGKGLAVYTPEELKSFQDQLNWIYYESGEFPEVRM
jgi:hypothetical protein